MSICVCARLVSEYALKLKELLRRSADGLLLLTVNDRDEGRCQYDLHGPCALDVLVWDMLHLDQLWSSW